MSTFKVAGISTFNGQTKVRFANDLVSRVKMLIKGGHTDIELMELPVAMTKPEVVTYLKTLDLYKTYSEVIDAADEKYNSGDYTVKVSASKVVSLDAIKARAGIVA